MTTKNTYRVHILSEAAPISQCRMLNRHESADFASVESAGEWALQRIGGDKYAEILMKHEGSKDKYDRVAFIGADADVAHARGEDTPQ